MYCSNVVASECVFLCLFARERERDDVCKEGVKEQNRISKGLPFDIEKFLVCIELIPFPYTTSLHFCGCILSQPFRCFL